MTIVMAAEVQAESHQVFISNGGASYCDGSSWLMRCTEAEAEVVVTDGGATGRWTVHTTTISASKARMPAIGSRPIPLLPGSDVTFRGAPRAAAAWRLALVASGW